MRTTKTLTLLLVVSLVVAVDLASSLPDDADIKTDKVNRYHKRMIKGSDGSFAYALPVQLLGLTVIVLAALEFFGVLK